MILNGGCHCGKVKFQVKGTFDKGVYCNCSICNKKGFIHHFATKEEFTLLTSWDDIGVYEFNTKTAKHLFCKHKH